jgi:hypothetical protein
MDVEDIAQPVPRWRDEVHPLLRNRINYKSTSTKHNHRSDQILHLSPYNFGSPMKS